MQWVLVPMVLVAGGAIALQPVMNAIAGDNMGHPIWGAIASAAVTFLVLALAPFVFRLPVPDLRAAATLPPWLYAGGLIGALMLFVALLAAPKLGVTLTAALIICGQLAAALVADHFGLLGLPVHVVNLPRLIGAVCLLGGVLLIRIH